MERIDAEEALAEVNVLQVGTGAAKRSRARELLARWRRLARRGPRKRMSEAEWRGKLAASGIRLEIANVATRKRS